MLIDSGITPGWSGSVRTAWGAMTGQPAAGPVVTGEASSPGLAQAVGIARNAIFGAVADGRRPIPSAGAIFPFSVLVLAATQPATGATRWQLYRLDEDGRQPTRLPLSESDAVVLARLLDQGPVGTRCHLLLLVRPWMSMRKYGARGYLYAHLDAGHAGASLIGATPSRCRAVLRLRVPRKDIREILGTDLVPFHEIHSVLSFTPDSGGDSAVLPVATLPQVADGSRNEPLESLCWQYLVGTLQQDEASSSNPGDSLLVRLPGGVGEPSTDLRRNWSRLAAARRSCRRFGTTRLDPQALVHAMSALGTALPVDLGPATAQNAMVRATLILGSGYRLDDQLTARLDDYVTVTSWPVDVSVEQAVAASRGQLHVGAAQAFVLFHVAEQRAVVEGQPQLLREALFRSGAAAHLLQLGAAGAGVAVSAIGRFGGDFWARIGRLPAGEEILYLLALGVPGDAA